MLVYAYGAFAGLLLGDAIGSYLEFYDGTITEELIDEAMKLPGGGYWRTGPGQITDDGELAITLANCLKEEATYNKEKVFKAYHDWFLCNPFDIGYTIRLAFSSTTIDENLECSKGSESNGALMRILPLAIWGHNLSDDMLEKIVREDTKLSHPNLICGDANVIYTLAVRYLLKNPNDNKGCCKYIQDYVIKNIQSVVKEWFLESRNEVNSCTTNIGHLRWAFQLSFYHLYHNSSFEEAIKNTLSKGGDTDTNCAIVGGIIGALHGIQKLPQDLLKILNEFDPSKSGRRRPLLYKPSNFYSIVDAILKLILSLSKK